jgi:hypothetical protein
MSDAETLRSLFSSTAGGVMTEEVGAITGELELLTRPASDGSGTEALVRYAGAGEWYSVAGSPVLLPRPGPHGGGNEGVHEAVLARLTTPGSVEGGNELPVDLRI